MALITLFSQYLRNVDVPCMVRSGGKCRKAGYPMFKLFPVSWWFIDLIVLINIDHTHYQWKQIKKHIISNNLLTLQTILGQQYLYKLTTLTDILFISYRYKVITLQNAVRFTQYRGLLTLCYQEDAYTMTPILEQWSVSNNFIQVPANDIYI